MKPYAQTILQLWMELADRPADERRRLAAAYDTAQRLFAGRFRANGKTFLAHLVGTAAVLARHGADTDTVIAGLLHAAYEQGDFGTRHLGPSPEKRAALQARVGERAEALVASYTGTDWAAALRAPARDALPAEVRFVRVANELEECLDGGLAFCGPRKQADGAASLAAHAEMARAGGWTDLAAEIDAGAARLGGLAVPEEFRAPRDASYTHWPLRCRGRRWRGRRPRL